MYDLIPAASNTLVQHDYNRLVAQWLSGRKDTTLNTYKSALRDFAAWLDVRSMAEVAESLLTLDAGQANAKILDYKNALIARELAPGTVNLRLAAIRSLVSLAAMLGIVSWTVRIKGLKQRVYRDTRGPGADGYRSIVSNLDTTTKPGKRDAAIVRLLYVLGLRRGEVVSLDLEDVDFSAGRVEILGKGRLQKEWVTIPPETLETLREWVDARGWHCGPLFVSLARGSYGKRLTGRSVASVVQKAGVAAELDRPVRPHGLRHAAITELRDQGASDRDVIRFSRHRSPDVLQYYDDNRDDIAGRLATKLEILDESR